MRYQLTGKHHDRHIALLLEKNDRDKQNTIFKDSNQREQRKKQDTSKIEQPMIQAGACIFGRRLFTLESLIGYMDFPGEWWFLCYCCVVHIVEKKYRYQIRV